MARWTFPPLSETVDLVGAIQALAQDQVRPVRDQHLVSKVLLKGFATRPQGKGWMLARYDLRRRRELDPKGLNACAKYTDFVQYASGSAEALWQRVESRLGDAISAAERGVVHADNSRLSTLKDAIALHLVRSPHYRRVHERSFVEAARSLRAELLETRRPLLESEFRRRYGLEAAGTEALELLLVQPFDAWIDHERSGALFRVFAEHQFRRVRAVLAETALEVLHAPSKHEFVVSDSPAFTFRRESDGHMSLRMAIGDSHGIGLPVTAKCFVSIGPDPLDVEASGGMVDDLNRLQVRLAERQIYYRPTSSARALVDMEANLGVDRLLRPGF